MAMDPSSFDTSLARLQLEAARRPLLHLHKALLEAERIGYEKEHGRIESGNALLQLVIADPWFAWLRPMSGLIVMIDEYLEDAKRPPADAVTLVNQVRAFTTPDEKHKALIQDHPAVAVAQRELANALSKP